MTKLDVLALNSGINTVSILFIFVVCLWDQREIFLFVWIDWVRLRKYSPADSADHAEECSKLHYSAEKDS